MRSTAKVGLLAAVMLLSFACNREDNVTSTPNEEEDSSPVRTEKIKKETITRTIEYTANLVAYKEIHYPPASPGRIDKILVDVDDRVTRGQVLVEMDKTQLMQAKAQYENARFNFQSIDTLYRLGSASKQQYEATKMQYEMAKSQYLFAQENSILESPIDGIVTGKYFEDGELYSGTPNTPAGKSAVLSLMQINPVKANVSISQSYFPLIKKGMSARVRTDIYPGKLFEGAVNKVYPTIDAATRTFQVEIIIKNSKEILRPGMFATIEIELKDVETIVVPAISVLKLEGTNERYVFVNDQGKAKQINVQLGKRFDDKIELVSSQIKVGDELIVEGQANLLDGSQLEIIN
ncbi:MAG: efflux RND transporter periplasmic adaptor subunit [Bacteroidales bacterium]|jgi:RND family efflux transporter MFP subunit|nr:efflux RND transporter periplasmic adaptor subunit [Bacteroidales bacterium]